MADQIDYYKVLGVPRNASQSEIRNAYRTLAKRRHPDHAGGSEAEFARLQEANAVLSDPNRRRQHDEALDLAHAADQLAGLNLDFGSFEDEVSQKRRERESQSEAGPSLSQRLRNRFRRGDASESSGGRAEGRGRRDRTPQRRARWYEPHDFDPEPITWKTGALSFVGAFIAFIVVGQIGFWAVGQGTPDFAAPWVFLLDPFMPIIYSLVGLVAAYLAYRTAGWAGVALVFVAMLVVVQSGQPESPPGMGWSIAGILALVAVIYLGNRRERAAWRDRR